MENIREINTGKSDIALVKLPEGSRDFKVFNDEISYLSLFEGYKTPRIYLPKGKWKVLNLLPDLTEEQFAELVEPEVRILSWADNTDMPEVEAVSCKEVFNDIMIANNCFTVNPYGDSDATEIRVHKGQEQVGELLLNGFNRVRQEAEASTGSWLVLVREKDL